jgi:hypothetical protein
MSIPYCMGKGKKNMREREKLAEKRKDGKIHRNFSNPLAIRMRT